MLSCHSSSLVIFLVSMALVTRANDTCIDDSWTYHRHTHTCLKYDLLKRTWVDSNSWCLQFQGGPNRSKPGHLVRIDDEETNKFVQHMVPEYSWIAFTGLYYNTGVNDYRWSGYPDEVPRYLQLSNSQPTPISSYPYMAISNYKWYGKSETELRPSICQHDAVTPGINLICPLLPLRVNAIPDQSITCQFLYNVWTSASITLGPSENLVGTCEDGKPCTVEDAYNMTVIKPADPNSVSLEFTDKVTRQQEGEWKCSVSNVNRILESKSCQINVYEPPTGVSCSTKLSGQYITIDCIIDRIYPRALCAWPYSSRKDDYIEQRFRLVDTTHSNTLITHRNVTENIYYKSVCSLTLTLDNNTKINPGIYSVQVLVYPDLAVSDSTFKETSGYKVETHVIIGRKEESEENGLGTDAIIGILVAAFLVVVAVTIISTLYVSKAIRNARKDRKRQETDPRVSHGLGQAESEFQGVGGAANEPSPYVYVPSDVAVKPRPAKNTAVKDNPQVEENGIDYINIDEVVQKPDANREPYDTLPPDDQNYINTKSQPRDYMKMGK